MKILLVPALLFCVFQFTSARADAPAPAAAVLAQELAQVGMAAFTDTNFKPGLIRHIVIFRYAPTRAVVAGGRSVSIPVTEADKERLKQDFLSLKQKCVRLFPGERTPRPYVLSIETGAQMSGEGVDQQYEQAFVVTFKSEGDRNFYVGKPVVTDPRFFDPSHDAFKTEVGAFLHDPVSPSGVLVFDYSTEAGH